MVLVILKALPLDAVVAQQSALVSVHIVAPLHQQLGALTLGGNGPGGGSGISTLFLKGNGIAGIPNEVGNGHQFKALGVGGVFQGGNVGDLGIEHTGTVCQNYVGGRVLEVGVGHEVLPDEAFLIPVVDHGQILFELGLNGAVHHGVIHLIIGFAHGGVGYQTEDTIALYHTVVDTGSSVVQQQRSIGTLLLLEGYQHVV